MSNMIVCSFSNGLSDMKHKDQSDPIKVLHVLVKAGRYSAFDACENMTIARMITRLHHKKLTYAGKNYGGPILAMDDKTPYPWTKVILTDAGRALIADYPPNTPTPEATHGKD